MPDRHSKCQPKKSSYNNWITKLIEHEREKKIVSRNEREIFHKSPVPIHNWCKVKWTVKNRPKKNLYKRHINNFVSEKKRLDHWSNRFKAKWNFDFYFSFKCSIYKQTNIVISKQKHTKMQLILFWNY